MKPVGAMPFIVIGLFGLYTLEFGVVGILPALIEHFGVTVSEAGRLTGLFALTVAVLGPGLVLISSRLARKTALVGSLAMFALCSLLSAFAHNFVWLLVLRIVAALFHPMFYATALATTISLFSAGRTGRAVSHAAIGTTLGLVIGVPMMSAIGSAVSYQASFLFCAGVSLVAGLGLLITLPAGPANKPPSFGEQLSILCKPALWLNIAAVILIFTALFSVYSYAAEYLKRQVGLSDAHISLTLVLFGIGGVTGNLLIGRLLDAHLVKTMLLLPLALGTVYLILFGFARDWMPSIGLIAVLWGGTHACGLVASQMWLRSVSHEAHDFASSLYLTAANAGVMSGSLAAGAAIARAGMPGVVWCGLAFCGLAVLVIALKAAIY